MRVNNLSSGLHARIHMSLDSMFTPCKQRTQSPQPRGRWPRRGMHAAQAALLCAAFVLVSACGGGSSSEPEPETRPNNRAPVISGTPSLHATAGVAYSFEPTAMDPNGDEIAYAVVNKPDWASFDPDTGQLSGTPPAGTAGTTSGVIISVSDGLLTTSLPAFDIEVFARVGQDQPSGIYSMDLVVDKPFVDGVAVRPKWSEMEPSEGTYDFSKIDKAVRDAAALGQGVTIASLVNFAPDWLRAKSSQFDHKGDPTIVPWDETMLQALEKLVEAQAAHQVDGVALRDHPVVKQVNASIGGVTSIRLLDLPPDYTAEKYTAAVERSIDLWASAYPSGKHLYVGLFPIIDGEERPSTAEIIRERLLRTFNGTTKPRIHFFQEVLTGQTPFADGDLGALLLGVQGRTGVMLQACGPWTSQLLDVWSCKWIEPVDTPDLGFQLGLETYGTLYFEMYNGDLLEESYSAQFETWHARIEETLEAAALAARLPANRP